MRFIRNKCHSFFILLSLLVLSWGCEKIIEINVPESDRKIVVNGLLNPDGNVRVNLTRSLTVVEKDSFIYLHNADVRLFRGNDLIGQMEPDTSGWYYLPGFMPRSGESYSLTAEYKGLTGIESQTTIPVPVPIQSVDTVLLTDSLKNRILKLNVKFHDPAGIRNYYGFSVNLTYKVFDYINMKPTNQKVSRLAFINQSDEFRQDESLDYGGKIYFDDLLFEGQDKNMEVKLSDYAFIESDTVWLDIHLEQVERPYFLYVSSSLAYLRSKGNPFSEPVQVYSNINGGFGIFSSFAFSRYPLVISGWRMAGIN